MLLLFSFSLLLIRSVLFVGLCHGFLLAVTIIVSKSMISHAVISGNFITISSPIF